MSPAVIDLTTSSPEPDDSPGKAARSALKNFQPRKQKADRSSSEASSQEDGKLPEQAARAALANFHPRKQSEKIDTSDSDNIATIGKFQPLLPDDARMELQNIRQQIQQRRSNGVELPGTSRDAVPPAVERHAPSTYGPMSPNDVRNGSHPFSLFRQTRAPLRNEAPGVQLTDSGTAGQQQQSPYLMNDAARVARTRKFNEFHAQHARQRAEATKGISSEPPRPNAQNLAFVSRQPATTTTSAQRLKGSIEVIDLEEQDVVSAASCAERTVAPSTGYRELRRFKRQRVGEPKRRPATLPNGLVNGTKRQHSAAENPSEQRVSDSNNEIPIASNSATLITPTSKRHQPSWAEYCSEMPIASAFTGLRSQPSSVKRLSNGVVKRSAVAALEQIPKAKPKSSEAESDSEDEQVDLSAWQTSLKHTSHLPPGTDGATGGVDKEGDGDVADLSVWQNTAAATSPRRASSMSRQEVKGALDTPSISPPQPVGDQVTSQLERELQQASGKKHQENTANQVNHLGLTPEQQGNDTPSNNRNPYSVAEDALLVKLKEVDMLSWGEMIPHFDGRSLGSLKGHYSIRLKARSQGSALIHPQAEAAAGPAHRQQDNHGNLYTPAEDALLLKLKEVKMLNWDEIVPHFNGRTSGSLQVRYSSKLKGRSHVPGHNPRKAAATIARRTDAQDDGTTSESPDYQGLARRQRKRRNNEVSVTTGFVSWADVKKKRLIDESETLYKPEESRRNLPGDKSHFEQERAYPKSLPRLLRQRELGSNGGRSRAPSTRSIPDELKEFVFDDVGPRRFFQGNFGRCHVLGLGARRPTLCCWFDRSYG